MLSVQTLCSAFMLPSWMLHEEHRIYSHQCTDPQLQQVASVGSGMQTQSPANERHDLPPNVILHRLPSV